MRKRLRFGIVMLFVLFGSVLIGALVIHVQHAHALSSNGPDTGEYGGAHAWYELSNTDYVVSQTMKIPVYYTSDPGTITVSVSCSSGSGEVDVAGNPICDSKAHNFKVGGFTYSSASDRYVAQISASLPGGNWSNNLNYRAYRLSVPGTGIIGYSSSNSSHFAIANTHRCDSSGGKSGCGKYFNYALPFAGQCSQGSGNQDIDLLDADNPDDDFGQYSTQPSAFKLYIIDITDPANPSNVAYSHSGSLAKNGADYTMTFHYTQYHHYQLALNGVYSNNVIQFHLPFDSIYSTISCPQGATVGGANPSCSAINGYMYNQADPTDAMSYYVYVNPPSGTPTGYASSSVAPSSSQGFLGSNPANLTNPPGTPSGVPHKRGFKVDLPSDVQGHHYNGEWSDNTYWIYAKAAGSSNIERVDTITVAPCGTIACSSIPTVDEALGSTFKPAVSMDINNAASQPPSKTTSYPTFSITILNADGTPTGYSHSGIQAKFTSVPPGGTSYNDPASTPSFTANANTTYQLQWSYTYATNKMSYPTSSSGTVVVHPTPPHSCGSGSVTTTTNPYYKSIGGDLSAGAGVPVAGSASCTTGTGGITGYDRGNLGGTVLPDFGAGSQLGEIANGTIGGSSSATNLDGSNSTNSSPTPVNQPLGLLFGSLSPYGHLGLTSWCVHDYSSDTGAGATTTPNYTKDGTYALPGGSHIGGITLTGGAHVTLKVTGDLYINNDITYNYNSLTDIPRLDVLVSGNIYIASNVQSLHGFYEAIPTNAGTGGNIYTCSSGPAQVGAPVAACGSNQLSFYGGITAKQIHLQRTYGNLYAAGSVTSDPAEQFVYSPELWVGAATNPTSTEGLEQYNAITSLPPVL